MQKNKDLQNKQSLLAACEKIKNRRLQLDIKQETLAKNLGIRQSDISKIESGKVAFFSDKLLLLLNELNLTFEDLFENEKKLIVKDKVGVQIIKSEDKIENSQTNDMSDKLLNILHKFIENNEKANTIYEKIDNLVKKIDILENNIDDFKKIIPNLHI